MKARSDEPANECDDQSDRDGDDQTLGVDHAERLADDERANVEPAARLRGY
jgi:hypothetical protein